MRSRYRKAQDGLPARVSGLWAREKLFFVERYMQIFNAGMKKKWPTRGIVDLMAGSGLCIEGDGLDAEFQGSPLLALDTDPPFTHAVFIEADERLCDALQARILKQTTPNPVVLQRSCNDPFVLEQIRKHIPSHALCLAFADMLGLEVEFETVRRLSENRKVDWLITFQVSDLTRNAREAVKDTAHGKRFDAFFGGGGWREIVRRFDAGERGGRELADALTTFYIEQLMRIGYAHVAQLHELMRNSKNAPLYRLILAGKHERAADFFDKISRINYAGARRLF